MTTINREFNGHNVIEYVNKNIYIIENVLNNEICDELKKMIDDIPKKKKNIRGNDQNDCLILLSLRIPKGILKIYSKQMLTALAHTGRARISETPGPCSRFF